MISQTLFNPVTPRALPRFEECIFYHSMTFADGSSVKGPWDIRGRFAEYIGNYPIRGKTMLDVGTASGFLTFSAEEAGAKVTALESQNGSEYCQLHFTGKPYHEDRVTFDIATNAWLETQKNGFWYGWHKNHSTSDVVYAPLSALPYWKKQFDVVLAGAILEHLSDPVSVIWSLTQLAREAVIIAYTPIHMNETLTMSAANGWDNPINNFTWWTLSLGLYERVFANVGFEVVVVSAWAKHEGVEHSRPTLIAKRR